MTLPRAFKRIRLELARSKEFPTGSARHGYEFVAPLDDNGHIDPKLWQEHRDHCRVRRFWNDEPDEIGRLVHKPGGTASGQRTNSFNAIVTNYSESSPVGGIVTFKASLLATGAVTSVTQ